MSRYYEITITKKNGDLYVPVGTENLNLTSSFTSYINGETYPGAWNIELDVPVATYALPMGGSYVRVWGISLKDINQAKNLNEASIMVRAGMAQGLPLAKPDQRGIIAQGTIFPAFGNWIGTDMTLDLMLLPPFGSIVQNAKPANLVLDWHDGDKMSVALRNTLEGAYEKLGYLIDVKIDDRLTATADTQDFQGTLTSLNSMARRISLEQLDPDKKGNYPGVFITCKGKTITAFDDSTKPENPTEISFEDLIGQPTWVDLYVVQLKCPMRGDLELGDHIKMPVKGALPAITSQSSPQYRDDSAFQGEFMVLQQRHVGNFRSPDSSAWVTIIDALVLGKSPNA